MTAKKKTPATKAASKRKGAKKRATTRTKKPAKKKATKRPKAAAPKVGTVLERRFKGEVYKLRVTADGFTLGKDNFHTLTSAARHVTNYKAISGPRFWLGTGTAKGGAA